jgi:hypothetical protein
LYFLPVKLESLALRVAIRRSDFRMLRMT